MDTRIEALEYITKHLENWNDTKGTPPSWRWEFGELKQYGKPYSKITKEDWLRCLENEADRARLKARMSETWPNLVTRTLRLKS